MPQLEGIHFDFNKTNLRVIELDGQPWFVGSDVMYALGIRQGGKNYDALDSSEYRVLTKKRDPISDLFVGRVGRIAVISESGLYKLIMRSDKPEARAFQDWVTKVVLPAIRKGREGHLHPLPNHERTHRQVRPSSSTILDISLGFS